MKRLVYITIVFLIFSCSNELGKEMQICNCMDRFELDNSDKEFEATKSCLEKVNISLDINDPTNSDLIVRMSEKGESICPEQSRKFWYFLKILDENSMSKTNNNKEDNTRPDQLEFLMVNNSQCSLSKLKRITEANDLLGFWNDTLQWRANPEDTCWYGLKAIGRRVELQFNSSKTYIWNEIYQDSSYSRTETGEYFLSINGELTTLSLMINQSADTLYEPGDTMVGRSFELYWPDSTRILLLKEPTDEIDNYPEVIEFKIKN